MKIFLIYFLVVWILSVIITVYDKLISKTDFRRVSEKTLLIIALIGGAFPMYVTMRMIHHKTRHSKFMVLLPLMVLLHIALLMLYFYMQGNVI